MKSSPIGGIYADKVQKPQTHINVALESLAVLDTTKDIFLRQNDPHINQTLLAKQFFSLLNVLHNYSSDACSLDLINAYTNYANSKNDQNALYQAPYNFLTYFLCFLDEEYNKALNLQNNIQKNSNQDLEKLANEIKSVIQSNKTSIINQNYFFTIIFNNKCNNCGTSKYEWAFKYIIDLELDN